VAQSLLDRAVAARPYRWAEAVSSLKIQPLAASMIGIDAWLNLLSAGEGFLKVQVQMTQEPGKSMFDRP
jgi:hypothetical protein